MPGTESPPPKHKASIKHLAATADDVHLANTMNAILEGHATGRIYNLMRWRFSAVSSETAQVVR